MPRRTRMKSSAHPGGCVKHDIIDPLGLSRTDAARILGVTRPTLSTLLNERATVFLETALRLEKASGVPVDTITRTQKSYDIGNSEPMLA